MTALSALRSKANEKYPPYPLQFDDGAEVFLKSAMQLEDDELALFNASQKRLKEQDDEEDLDAVKEEMVNLLAGVSTDPARTASELEKETLGTLMTLFEEYSESLSAGAKSEGTS